MTPETVHYGRATMLHQLRAAALDAAFLRNPLASKTWRLNLRTAHCRLDQPTEKGTRIDND